MKSKFFGFNAKLALGLLAVIGMTFTSCYESEGDDMPLPYNPPAATYTIVGTVTDVLTGTPVSGITVKLGTASVTTVDGGAFTFTTEETGSQTLTVDATDKYEAFTGGPTIVALKPGQSATYMFNVALTPKDFQELPISQFQSQPNGISKDTKTLVDVLDEKYFVNKTNNSKNVAIDIVSSWGGRIEKDDLGIDIATRSITVDALKAYMKNFLMAEYDGFLVEEGEDFMTVTFNRPFTIAPQSFIESITVIEYYRDDTYKFTVSGVDYTIVVKAVDRIEYIPTEKALHEYHGHGHGHGGSLNAGGGIINPIN